MHWSENTDSHHEIITELGLKETGARGEINIVPIEITPPDGDLSAPVNKWVFRIDHAGYGRDIPEWWDGEKGEAAVRASLKDWKKQKVVTRKTAVLNAGQYYICGKAEVCSVEGTANVSVRDSAVIKYVGGSAVINDVGGSAVIKYVRGSAVINDVGDSATIIVYTVIDPQCLKSSTAVMIDRSTYGKVTVTAGKNV